jgi:hypothetical protein
LPVRFGVFILTVLSALTGTLIAAVGWVQIAKLQNQLTNSAKVAIYINSAVYTLLGVLAVFGFIGACIKNRAMISTFLSILIAHLVFSIFSGAFTLHNVFTVDGDAIIQGCQDGNGSVSSDISGVGQASLLISRGLSHNSCVKAYDVVKGISVAMFIFVWLIEIWGCVITNDYITQLDDEVSLWPRQNKADLETAQLEGPRLL